MRVPGIKKASKVDVPVTTTDILPTLLDLAGLDHPESDGASLKPLLYKKNFNNGKSRSLVFHYPHYYSGTTPVSVLRRGRPEAAYSIIRRRGLDLNYTIFRKIPANLTI